MAYSRTRPCASVYLTNGMVCRQLVREDEFDFHAWIGVPMDGAAAARRRAGPAHEHLQERRRLRVRLILGVFPLDADDVAKSLARPMTRPAHFHRGTQIGDAGDRPRDLPRDDVIELPQAVHLVLDEGAAPFTDMAVDACDLRVRGVLPRRELRVHRFVARLAAEGRGFHRVERAVSRDQHDHGIDGRQRDEHQRLCGASSAT